VAEASPVEDGGGDKAGILWVRLHARP
jgi:hypothetical protein